MNQDEIKKQIEAMTADSRVQLEIHKLVKELASPIKKDLRVLVMELDQGQLDRGRLIEKLEKIIENIV